MATDKKKRTILKGRTPRGVFRFPSLDKADYGTEAHPCPEGRYKVGVILSEAEAAPLLKTLEPLLEQARIEGEEGFAGLKVEQRKKLKELTMNDLYSVEYDRETEEPTGNLIFNFKMAASGTSKKANGSVSNWNRKPALFDAKGKPLTGKLPEIWGGTVGVVAFEAYPYFIAGTGTAGVSLKLSAAQIIELRSGGQRDASDFGFDEEDGWSAPPSLLYCTLRRCNCPESLTQSETRGEYDSID
jgi:hypothetical protein